MSKPQINAQRDTPFLSFLIGIGVIIGGLPALIVLFTEWAGSPYRQVAAVVGIVTIAIFAFLRRKYEALLIALLFFSQFQISLLSIPLDKPAMFQIAFSDILLVLFMVAAIERKESLRPDTVGWLLFGLIAWQAVGGFLFSAHLHHSLIFLLWEMKYLFVYLLVCNVALSENLARQIKIAIFLVLFLQGGMAMAQLVTGSPLGLKVFGEQDSSRLFYVKEGLRVSGTLGATNALAGYMAILLVFALPFLFRWQGLFGYACFGIGFAALLFALSRAGWLSFVVGASIVVGRLLWDGILKPTRILILVFIGTAIIGVGASMYLDRIQERFEDKAAVDSAMGRFYQFEEAWPVIERYPVFGIGPGVTEYYGAWNENKKYVRNKLPGVELGNQPHNSQLQYWIESGTLGFIFFTAIIIMTFMTVLPRQKEFKGASELLLMQIGAGAAAVTAMVHASFGTEINHHQIGMAFWILFALARNQTKQSFPASETEISGPK